MTTAKSEQSLLVSEGMVEYWANPRTKKRRALQAKIREREAQLARLERHDMTHTDRYAYILSKLEQARAQLEQLR
jgi:hypothetical protein